MAITFECFGCGKPLSAKSDYAGKQGKCKCGTRLIVPGNVKRMKFACPHCGNGISVSPRHTGKKGKCPTCHKKISIPYMAKKLTSDSTVVPLRRSKPTQTVAAAPILSATAVSPAASFVPASFPVPISRPELILDIIDVTCQTCNTRFKDRQSPQAKMIECPSCGSLVQVSGTETSVSANILTQRARKNRIYRIYWILSLIALIGPLSYLATYILFSLIMDGVSNPATEGLIYLLGMAIRIFPLFVSPLAIGLALFLKFRYNIKSVWPLNTAILCYAVYVYNLI